MKKKAFFVATLCLLIVGIITLTACSGSLADRYKDNISELRTDIYKHTDDMIGITVISGIREKNFALDGITKETQEFSIITIVPTSGINKGITYDYTINIGDKEYSGSMLIHPFEENYSVEIAKQTSGGNIKLHLVSNQGYLEDFELATEYKSNMIDYRQALDIAQKKLKDRFEQNTVNKKLHAELFIRFVENPLNAAGGYFWYVALVDTNGGTYAVLIDPINEKVLAARE